MKPLLLQCYGDADYAEMIEEFRPRHELYSRRHGYVYKIVGADRDASFNGWERLERILAEIETGQWSHVFWLDADCFVADLSRDMRDTLPEWASYAFTIHPFPIATYRKSRYHWQTGQMYFRADEHAKWFLENCLSNNRRAEFVNEQVAINCVLMMLAEAQKYLNTLYQSWNNTMHDEVPDGTIVAAFHGYGYVPRVFANIDTAAYQKNANGWDKVADIPAGTVIDGRNPFPHQVRFAMMKEWAKRFPIPEEMRK